MQEGHRACMGVWALPDLLAVNLGSVSVGLGERPGIATLLLNTGAHAHPSVWGGLELMHTMPLDTGHAVAMLPHLLGVAQMHQRPEPCKQLLSSLVRSWWC